MTNHKSLSKLPAAASKIAVTTLSHRRLSQKKQHLPSTQTSKREGQRFELGLQLCAHQEVQSATRRRSQQCAPRDREPGSAKALWLCADEVCESWWFGMWMARGKDLVFRGRRVCAGAHEQPTNNWLSVGQRVGFTTSVAVAQAVSSPRQCRSNNNGGAKTA